MYGNAVVAMSLVMLLAGLLGLLSSVFLAFAVYYDARIRSDSNAVLWAVLSGFFNIVALVYLIVRAASKPKPVYCMRCRNYIPPGYTACPCCGLPVVGAVMPPSPEEIQKMKKRRLLFIILFIALYVVTFVLTFWFIVVFLQGMMDFSFRMNF